MACLLIGSLFEKKIIEKYKFDTCKACYYYWLELKIVHLKNYLRKIDFMWIRKMTVLNWNDIWEWGNGEGTYKLANAGYKVNFVITSP